MLVVSRLSFGYRHRRLFSELSMTVAAGELVHLAGPNGAGKSTCMAIIAGLLTADGGSVEFFPSPGGVAAEDRRHWQEYLPAEGNGLYLKMDATQNLLFWSRLRGLNLDAEAVHAALDPWGLSHPLLRQGFAVEKFSTGMKRRLALARLALSPAPCWLLDEPVYGLDAQAMDIFQARLSAHLQRGGMALVVSHDLKPLTGLISRSVALGAQTPVRPLVGSEDA